MIRLFVLGILNQKTMHGYELYQQLERSRIDLWSDVLPGSIYHAFRQMDKEGLVRIRGTEQTGIKTRAIYEIT
jgi:DNA-binding PadR family transcriptional regulator